jgi:4-diphosphocytidyl-2-C-methyl-D-erythritol kinase
LRELAPAKVNVCLYLGPLRPDGYHELLSVIQSITLADELELSDRDDGDDDEVRCPGLDGPNLAASAIAAFRASTGWDGPPQLLEITKRIPVAAGLGGGSADAAATLRLLARRSGSGTAEGLHEIATALGADVPSQLHPGRWLAEGIGERLTRLPDPDDFGVVVLPSKAGLSAKAVYQEADRLGLTRTSAELEALLPTLTLPTIEPCNDLEPAARSLEPTIDDALTNLRGSIVSGSGPTVIGLFPTLEGARNAADGLARRGLDAQAAGAVHNSSFA